MSQPDRPTFRPSLADLPAYKAGKPAVSADGSPAYKLSSNENPYEPLPGVVDAAHEALLTMNRYPDAGVTDLHVRLASQLGVQVDQLASATGSVALLYQLIQATCAEGDEVVYAWRSFEAYPIAVGVSSARSVQVPLGPGARHDLTAMLEAVTDRTKVVIVCSPNNPTGPCVHADELREFLDAVPPHVVVVLDEAYREFVRDPHAVDGVEAAHRRDNVVVMRTFSKAYGLAGLRVGFMVASPEVAEAVRKCSLPFGVSSVAQTAAIASLDAQEALMERVEQLVDERTRVVNALVAQGWDVPETHANFVWLALGERTAEFADAATAAGVSVRPFPGEGARVSIGEVEANDIFLRVAADFGA